MGHLLASVPSIDDPNGDGDWRFTCSARTASVTFLHLREERSGGRAKVEESD